MDMLIIDKRYYFKLKRYFDMLDYLVNDSLRQVSDEKEFALTVMEIINKVRILLIVWERILEEEGGTKGFWKV